MHLIKPKQDGPYKKIHDFHEKNRLSMNINKDIPPIYEMDEIYTQEVMLPYANNDHIQFLQRNSSDMLKDRDRHHKNNLHNGEHNAPIIGFSQQLKGSKREQNKSPTYTRQNIYEMNKKHRNIRTTQYKRSSKKTNENCLRLQEDLQMERPILTAREAPINNQKIFTRKNIMSSFAQKAVNNLMKQNEIGTPKRAVSTQEFRSQVKRKMPSNERQRAVQLRRHNPLVIYPFESKLKVRRIDDNPKILSNIIRKKFKQMQREDLHLYINGLIHRKEK